MLTLATSHAGTGFLMSKLQKKLDSKDTYNYRNRCRLSTKTVGTVPTSLPVEGAQEAGVFYVSGVNLYLRNKKKVWVVTFTCAVFRAVWLRSSKRWSGSWLDAPSSSATTEPDMESPISVIPGLQGHSQGGVHWSNSVEVQWGPGTKMGRFLGKTYERFNEEDNWQLLSQRSELTEFLLNVEDSRVWRIESRHWGSALGRSWDPTRVNMC